MILFFCLKSKLCEFLFQIIADELHLHILPVGDGNSSSFECTNNRVATTEDT